MKLNTLQAYLIFILILGTTLSVLCYFRPEGFEQGFSNTSPLLFQFQLSLIPAASFLTWWWKDKSSRK
jgi:hypothetical protein